MYGQRLLYRLHSVWSSGHLRGVFKATHKVSNLLWSHNTEGQDLYLLKDQQTLFNFSAAFSLPLYFNIT